ncbi:HAD-superfamily hydrolase [Naviculisporaceae sp. PSN 640]
MVCPRSLNSEKSIEVKHKVRACPSVDRRVYSLLLSPILISSNLSAPRPNKMRFIKVVAALCSATSQFLGVTAHPTTQGSASTSQDLESAPAWSTWPFAFAFDIDGVLLQGKEPIKDGLVNETLAWLTRNKIPFVLLTNGGGKTEQARAEDLNQKLETQLTADHIIQSHTPFAGLLDEPENLRKKTVLATGSDYNAVRAIMENYGFESVITPGDIWKAHPSVFTFVQESEKYKYDDLPPLPKPIFTEKSYGPDTDLSKYLKVDAMFILNDVRDWALDYQIMMDLLLSHQGYFGTYSLKNQEGEWGQDNQTKLYYSNIDLVWGAPYHLPRYGQGVTKAALDGIWRAHTGGGAELVSYAFGKPTQLAYQFAERRLREVRDKLYGDSAAPPLKRVYMVGDNPESDIAGPNTYKSENGTKWYGLLVKTGVYDPDRSPPFTDITRPLNISDNFNAAVRFALDKEGVDLDPSDFP